MCYNEPLLCFACSTSAALISIKVQECSRENLSVNSKWLKFRRRWAAWNNILTATTLSSLHTVMLLLCVKNSAKNIFVNSFSFHQQEVMEAIDHFSFSLKETRWQASTAWTFNLSHCKRCQQVFCSNKPRHIFSSCLQHIHTTTSFQNFPV